MAAYVLLSNTITVSGAGGGDGGVVLTASILSATAWGVTAVPGFLVVSNKGAATIYLTLAGEEATTARSIPAGQTRVYGPVRFTDLPSYEIWCAVAFEADVSIDLVGSEGR
jgi:hypothetical protein